MHRNIEKRCDHTVNRGQRNPFLSCYVTNSSIRMLHAGIHYSLPMDSICLSNFNLGLVGNLGGEMLSCIE